MSAIQYFCYAASDLGLHCLTMSLLWELGINGLICGICIKILNVNVVSFYLPLCYELTQHRQNAKRVKCNILLQGAKLCPMF